MAISSYINCFLSLPALILEGYIKFDYLVKSYMHWQLFIEMLF